jgi:predicted transcriptional regulator
MKKVLLYELNSIVKKLYPNKRTTNPYKEQITDYLQQLPITEQLLFESILHTLTIINQKGRIKEKHTIISSRNDVLNALELIQEQQRILPNKKSLECYELLYKKYQNNPVTLLDAQVILRKSQSSIKRYFKALEKLDLVELVKEKRGHKYQYRLLEKMDTHTTKEPSIYDQAFEEFKDYSGFTNLQQRT